MTRKAVVDTGPLVAFLDRRESNHEWARERFKELEAPLLTCEAVMTEALFVLHLLPEAQDHLLGLTQSGALRIAFVLEKEIKSIRALRRKYSDRPMSLADACLVRMAEQFGDHHILTLDSDFTFYRKHGRASIPLILPGG